MLKWLMWLQGERQGAKHEAAQTPEAAKPEERGSAGERVATKEAVREAEQQWDEDGERADQDYYHVPGAANPDRTDPPVLDGKPLPKPKPKKSKTTARR